jgi:tetratricopeptide (TPR) repeat protein
MLLLASYGNITQMKAIERAQPMIEKALAIDPESAEAFAALGLARWQIGQTNSAESALRQAISLNEDYVPARLWLGGLLGDLGRIPEQAMVLQEAMAIDPLNELLAVNYASNLFSQGDYESTRDLMSGLIQLKPDSSMLLKTMANFAYSNGDLVESWEYARRSYELEPESPQIINAMAQAWLNLEEYDRAEEILKEGLALASDNGELKIQYFFLMLVSERMEEAEQMVKEQFGQDIETLPEQFQRFYHYQMGLIHLLKGNFNPARDELRLAINPDEAGQFDGNQILSMLVVSYLNEKLGDSEAAEERLASAERLVRRARINGIDHAYIYYTESSIHALRGEAQEAIVSLREAYNRGWRQKWLLDMDGRMEILWDEPEFIAIKQQIEDDVKRARAEVLSEKVVMN